MISLTVPDEDRKCTECGETYKIKARNAKYCGGICRNKALARTKRKSAAILRDEKAKLTK